MEEKKSVSSVVKNLQPHSKASRLRFTPPVKWDGSASHPYPCGAVVPKRP